MQQPGVSGSYNCFRLSFPRAGVELLRPPLTACPFFESCILSSSVHFLNWVMWRSNYKHKNAYIHIRSVSLLH